MRVGWEQRRLGEVCSLINRGVAPKYVEAGGIAVLNQKCVRDHEVSFEIGRRHDVQTKKVDPERYIRVGDVLVNSTGTGTLGRVAQIRVEPPEPTTVDTHVTIVRPEEGRFYLDFFGYMLIRIEDEIARSGEGSSGQTELARSTLQNKFLVSFPASIAEQQRIVAILDEAFAGLATATANAEKNLKNARELFDSCLGVALGQRGESWPVLCLEEAVDERCSLSYGIVQPGDEKPDGLPIVRPVDMTTKIIRVDGLKRIKPSCAESYSRTKLRGGELLLCVRGTTGAVAIAASELSGANVTRGIVPIYFNASLMTQRFGYYALLSERVQRQIKEKTYGTALMQINIRDLRNLLVPIPPLAEQEYIATRLSTLSQEILRLQDLYQAKLNDLTALKQSLLQKAFSGELTAPPSQAINEAAE